MSEQAIALLSGGLNSFVATRFAQSMGYTIVESLCFNYGQPHCDEIDAARELAAFLNTPYITIDMSFGWEMYDRLPQIRRDALLTRGVNESFWPGRLSMILLAGSARAQSMGVPNVITGITDGSVSVNLVDRLKSAMVFDDIGVDIEAPFAGAPTGHAFKVAHALEIWDQALMMTYDCLSGEHDDHDWGRGCGECAGCKARIEAHETEVNRMKEELERRQSDAEV